MRARSSTSRSKLRSNRRRSGSLFSRPPRPDSFCSVLPFVPGLPVFISATGAVWAFWVSKMRGSYLGLGRFLAAVRLREVLSLAGIASGCGCGAALDWFSSSGLGGRFSLSPPGVACPVFSVSSWDSDCLSLLLMVTVKATKGCNGTKRELGLLLIIGKIAIQGFRGFRVSDDVGVRYLVGSFATLLMPSNHVRVNLI